MRHSRVLSRETSGQSVPLLLRQLPLESIWPADEVVEAWKWADPWLVPYLERLPRILFYALQGISPQRIAGRLPGLRPVEVPRIERVLDLVADEAERRAKQDRRPQRGAALGTGGQASEAGGRS